MKLYNYQKQAVEELQNGNILCGGVGSGKSITALAYYMFKVCKGSIPHNDGRSYKWMEDPRDLYIITTAKKRDSLEWDKECAKFCLRKERDASHSGIQVTIDSWNNIKKYKNVYGAFFIFDEQRVVGSGAWVKTFLNIVRKNQWILLSATPGDQWKDYIPVFVANGFYRNKTDFNSQHCVFSRFSKYPKIERYVGEKILQRHKEEITVYMEDQRNTERHIIYVPVEYSKAMYHKIFKERWDPYDNCPIEESGKLMYLIRKIVNSDGSRLVELNKIIEQHKKVIVFYNFNYELDILKNFYDVIGHPYAEWNGNRHEELPEGDEWIYLVQYSAGCEGWNCITCDTIVFYSQNYSYRITEQAAGRIDRINTPYKDLYYYYLQSSAPIDIAIRRALQNKKNFNEKRFISGTF